MIHLHAVAQPQQGAVLVPITPDEQALELGRMIFGIGHKSHDLWSQIKVLTAVQAYFENLSRIIGRVSRNTDDIAKAAHFELAATILDEDAIPGLQSFLDDQLEAGNAADLYWQGQDVARKLNQDERVLG
ncbi:MULTISPECIES: hypothetical protein [unclassified Saccharibacter]|uniref:hypothetical protein n=1 Tax=unclassified Saccharibacter TaxID=2648722 RepID=UPI001324AA98|nr:MULTISPECIES: hypothetical protein [unclassified Saccharibacter]MXV35939.1 hypothetical protein [Saccharibacter sp. EH611]MXV58373.1 hypothetical protein [Saccharibacter sp. EH70]MXV65829.1 hypothetical protein [Saccharibacter sp. EH60]